jgi:DNA ligase-1
MGSTVSRRSVFALGSGLSDALRREPPPIGVWVTYRYRDRTPSGLPRFASFLRVREAE